VKSANLSAIDTKFRLVHVMSGCVLFSHKVKVISNAIGLTVVT
jgi:dolichyl-phosphate-mannose--protein O-mannosyl transferase